MILDGKSVAEKTYSEIREKIEGMVSLPSLVLLCDEPDSSNKTYMKSIVKQGEKLGINVVIENT